MATEPEAMAPEAKSAAKSSRYGALQLTSLSLRGKGLGLHPGDTLVRIDGKPFDGTVTRLLQSFAGQPDRKRVLWFVRDGLEWPVVAKTAALGQWRSVHLPEGFSTGALPTIGLRNWDVLVNADGAYDVQPTEASGFAFLAPLYLLQMRLWGPLALWAAVSALALPLGWVAGSALQVLLCLYFWRASPTLMRSDRFARGFRYWRIMAARNERDLHEKMAEIAPGLRFVLMPPKPELATAD